MAGIVSNIIQNSLSGFVSGAVTTIGGYAGDAVGGVGNIIERGGQTVGDGISRAFRSYGDGINAYGTAAKAATAPNGSLSQSKTAVKRLEQGKKESGGTAKKALPSSTVGTQKLLTYPGYGSAPRPGLGSRKDSTETVKTVKGKAEETKALAKYSPYTGYKGAGGSYTGLAAKKVEASAAAKKPGSQVNGSQKGQPASVGKKVVPEKRSKPGYKPPPSVAGSTYAPSDAGSTVGSDFKPAGGFVPRGGYQPGGEYKGPGSTVGGSKGPGSTVGGYRKEPNKPATNADTLKAKNVTAGGVKRPTPPKAPTAPSCTSGGSQRNNGKVRISKESRPKKA